MASAAHWLVAVPLTVLTLPLSVGAGELPVQYSDPCEGRGMGLAIVRRIANRFGWPVELDSTAGRGTTAFLRFPAAISVNQALPQGA